MPFLRLVLVPTVLISLLLAGCPEKECAPGATQACVCAGGADGAQICADDGMSWGPCDCGIADDDDDDDATPADDDDATPTDDDDATPADDDDATPGDDDDDDATPGDDDDATPGDDDDDDSEPCCSDCDYPAYVVDSLSLVTFLESATYNEFLDLLLADALPPIDDTVIILLDPDQDLTGVSSFNARFGVGVVDQDLFSFDGAATYVDWAYSQDGSYNFASTGTGQMLNLSFGVSVPIYEAAIAGTFSATYDAITTGAITGAIQEVDTEAIETSFGNLHDLMDGRALDVDLDGDGTMDSWTFEMAFTAYQFL